MAIEEFWKCWVLDISIYPPVFCPFNESDGSITVGMNVISNKCPGKFIGIYHDEGKDAINSWIKDNPDWKSRYDFNETKN